MNWSSICPEWETLQKGYTEVHNTIEEILVSLKEYLRRGQDWLSKPANRNWLIVKGVKYTVVSVLFGGTLVLVAGPQGAAIAGSGLVAWKLVEKLIEYFGVVEKLTGYFDPWAQKFTEYFAFTLPEGWSGYWAWFKHLAWFGVQALVLGPTGLLWIAAEWCADRVSEGVQKVMEWFGAEFEAPKLD